MRPVARNALILSALVIAACTAAYCARPAPPDPAPALVEAAAAVIVADTTRAQAGRAVAELAPATQRTRARHVASSAVVVVFNDSTLALQETPAAAPIPLAVPPPVVERIRAADAFAAQLERENGALRELVRADTAAIDTRDTKMELLTPRRRRCGTTCKTVIVVAALAAGREVAKRTGFRITVSRG